MAVTLTLLDLARQVRVSASGGVSDIPTAQVAVLTRDLAAATDLVERRAPDAPDSIQNKAVVQVVGYWLDAPAAPPQRYGYNAWLQSGAAGLLGPYIERRAEPV